MKTLTLSTLFPLILHSCHPTTYYPWDEKSASAKKVIEIVLTTVFHSSEVGNDYVPPQNKTGEAVISEEIPTIHWNFHQMYLFLHYCTLYII